MSRKYKNTISNNNEKLKNQIKVIKDEINSLIANKIYKLIKYSMNQIFLKGKQVFTLKRNLKDKVIRY